VGWDEGAFDGVGVDSCNSNSIEFDGIRIGIAEVDGMSFARFFSTAVAGGQECPASLFWLQAVAKLGSFAWKFCGLGAGGFYWSCGLAILACEIHDLVAAVPLVLFHGVHHGVIVPFVGVEDFSPLFTDFSDEWIVIHDLMRLFRERG